jgi:hypothetical protein
MMDLFTDFPAKSGDKPHEDTTLNGLALHHALDAACDAFAVARSSLLAIEPALRPGPAASGIQGVISRLSEMKEALRGVTSELKAATATKRPRGDGDSSPVGSPKPATPESGRTDVAIASKRPTPAVAPDTAPCSPPRSDCAVCLLPLSEVSAASQSSAFGATRFTFSCCGAVAHLQCSHRLIEMRCSRQACPGCQRDVMDEDRDAVASTCREQAKQTAAASKSIANGIACL